MTYRAAWIANIAWAANTWRAVAFIASSYAAASTADTIKAMTYWTSCCTVQTAYCA